MPLERNPNLRDQPGWVDTQLPEALFLPMYQNAHLVSGLASTSGPRVVYLSRDEINHILPDCHLAYLGHGTNQGELPTGPVFSLFIDEQSTEITQLIEEQENKRKENVEFVDLRKLGPLLDYTEGAILGYARGLCLWHANHRFCSRCGSESESKRGGHMRRCQSSLCSKEIYPRIDPAVIMLVEMIDPEDGIPRCLLGRSKGLPKGIYSTLAGYVDPGESMEEAVAREVKEESGVHAIHCEYVASQPWPFPSSLMIGFRAKTHDTDIDINLDELEDADWFTIDQVRSFGEYTDPDVQYALPRKDSIARMLIDMWIQENENESDLRKMK